MIPAHEAPGVWMGSTTTDLIFVDASLPLLARTQTVLHELAHIILGHRGARPVDSHTGDPAEENEAELAADILATWLTRARARPQALSIFWHRTSIGPHIRLVRWWTRWQRHWQMWPLWLALRDGAITIRSTWSRTSAWGEGFPLDDPVSLTSLSHAYYRRTIEILDGLRQVGAYVDPNILNQARYRARRACLPEAEVDAIAAATAVRAALHAHASGAPPRHAPPDALIPATTADLDTVAAHFVRTAQALTTSPYVLLNSRLAGTDSGPSNTAAG
ncbi:DUF6545 domain-containing protein [Solwaraspora sp. WMMB335]|uniref:DUF6545 domain-containing protein n=1 Tax=Solwaraspora sp. WMMB335 TaxID=3404118 RepID=UPI003B926F82